MSSTSLQKNISGVEPLLSLDVPVLPVIKVETVDEIIPVGEAMLEGGIAALEITLRSEAGLGALALAKQRFPEAVVCAGTAINADQLRQVKDAGIDLVLSPGMTSAMLETAAELSMTLVPGVATPSEVMLAHSFGVRYCKLFPAAVVGGANMLKSLADPLADVKFCPTGGVRPENFTDFLNMKNVFCVGGTWILSRDDNGRFDYEKTLSAAKDVKRRLQTAADMR